MKEAGAVQVLTKPVDYDLLKQILGEMVEHC